jgi:hypothetical protein
VPLWLNGPKLHLPPIFPLILLYRRALKISPAALHNQMQPRIFAPAKQNQHAYEEVVFVDLTRKVEGVIGSWDTSQNQYEIHHTKSKVSCRKAVCIRFSSPYFFRLYA